MNSLNYFLRLAVEMSRNNPHYEWNDIPELFRLRISHTVPTPFLCLTLAEIALVGAFAILILTSGSDCITHKTSGRNSSSNITSSFITSTKTEVTF